MIVSFFEPYVISTSVVTPVTGAHSRAFNLMKLGNEHDTLAVEVAISTNGVAPGADRSVTLNMAFCSQPDADPAELATCAIQHVCDLPNEADVRRFFLTPLQWQGAQYLYVWFDHSARDAGSNLSIETRINVKR